MYIEVVLALTELLTPSIPLRFQIVSLDAETEVMSQALSRNFENN